jgi:FKBP-type peptidyl-prolyl cis-trans isomerase FkpA
MRRFLTPLFALLIAGCSSAGVPSSGPNPFGGISFTPALQVDLGAMERTARGVYFRDLAIGEGPEARRGHRVRVHFAGFLPDGTQIDALAPPAQPMAFELGKGDVIPGWEAGIVGMREGGQRQLVVPPAQGYGSRGRGRVPPNATLVFVIKLVSVR